MNERLRIALPKGRMSDESLEYFQKRNVCSIKTAPAGRELIIQDEKNNTEFYLVRSKDVGAYVEQGAADMGIMGLDLLLEHEFDVFIPIALPFGECRLSVAYPEQKPQWTQKQTITVATKYPKLTTEYFFKRGFNIRVIELYGSIEIAPLTGLSDIIVDLVSSGQTLKANRLAEEEKILHSSARLILNKTSFATRRARIQHFIDQL